MAHATSNVPHSRPAMVPWKVLETVTTREGELQLRQRGAREFLTPKCSLAVVACHTAQCARWSMVI